MMRNSKLITSVSVVVPVFNEARAISKFMGKLQETLKEGKFKAEIVVVNDGSTDGSGKILAKVKGIRVFSHQTNRGYGEAIKTGVNQSRYENIAIIDCDGTYEPEDLLRLFKNFSGQIMVVGLRDGKRISESVFRKLTKKFLSRLAGYLSETKIGDLNSGMRVFGKREFLRFSHLFPSGFSLTSTITLAFLICHYPVKYVPISYHSRVGRSKIRPCRDVLSFLSLILTTIIYFNPLKVFLPLSLLFFFLSFLIGIGSFLFLPQFLDTTTVILFVAGFQILSIGILADMISKNNARAGWKNENSLY